MPEFGDNTFDPTEVDTGVDELDGIDELYENEDQEADQQPEEEVPVIEFGESQKKPPVPVFHQKRQQQAHSEDGLTPDQFPDRAAYNRYKREREAYQQQVLKLQEERDNLSNQVQYAAAVANFDNKLSEINDPLLGTGPVLQSGQTNSPQYRNRQSVMEIAVALSQGSGGRISDDEAVSIAVAALRQKASEGTTTARAARDSARSVSSRSNAPVARQDAVDEGVQQITKLAKGLGFGPRQIREAMEMHGITKQQRKPRRVERGGSSFGVSSGPPKGW